MIVCLYGPDSLRRKRKLDALLSAYRARTGASDILVADCEDDPEGPRRVREFMSQASLFDSVKVAIVAGGGSIDDPEWTCFLKAERQAERRFLFLADLKRPRASLAFLLKPPVKSQEFTELEGSELTRFFRGECATRHIALSPEHERITLSFFRDADDRSWRIVRMLDQLALFIGAGGVLSAHVLEALAHCEKREEMFRIVRTLLAAPHRSARLAVLEEALASGDAAYVFNALAFQARGGDLCALGEYDVSIKSGGLEYEEALADFVLRGSS